MRILLLLFTLFFIVPVWHVYAQTNKVDSLNKYIHLAKTLEQKLRAMIAYTDEYYNINHDSLSKYTAEALLLSNKVDDPVLKMSAQLMLAYDYIQWGWADSARLICDKALPECSLSNKNMRPLYFKFLRTKVVSLGGEGRMEEGLELLYKLIPDAEKYKDTIELAIICNTIGFIASARNDLKEGFKWNDRAVSFAKSIPKGRLGSIYITRGSLYYRNNQPDSALFFLDKGILLCAQDEYIDRLVSAYRLQSAILSDKGAYDAAYTALINMIETRNLLNHEEGYVVDDNIQIADFYANTGRLQKAIDLCRKFLVTGELKKDKSPGSIAMNNDAATQLPYYSALAGYLEEAGDTKGYIDALEHIIDLKDSVATLNNADAIAEMQAKYDVQEKEKTILMQQLELTRRKTLMFGTLGFTLMAGIAAWQIFRNQRRKQQEKLRLAIEQEKRQAAQTILESEEKERKRIAADLHDNIGGYATAIRDDVDKIASDNNMSHLQHLKDHSQEIINSLRDTIWVLNKEHIAISNISDRFKNYISKLMPSYPQMAFHIEENINEDISVPSRNALNIFRIMQEAVHNALKHSNAKNINTYIVSNDYLLIKIIDDGVGIHNSNNKVEGMGLTNMKERATEIGMVLLMDTIPSSGTSITLQGNT